METYFQLLNRKENPATEQDYLRLQNQIFSHELLVLQAISFEMTVNHPHKYVVNYVKALGVITHHYFCDF